MDSKGVKYILTSDADYLCRSKVLYHDGIVVKKSGLIEDTLRGMIEACDKIHNSSSQMLLTSATCEEKLGGIMRRKGTVLGDNVDLIGITPAGLKYCNVSLLISFYSACIEVDFVTYVWIDQGW